MSSIEDNKIRRLEAAFLLLFLTYSSTTHAFLCQSQRHGSSLKWLHGAQLEQEQWRPRRKTTVSSTISSPIFSFFPNTFSSLFVTTKSSASQHTAKEEESVDETTMIINDILPPSPPSPTVSKFRQLKDLMWIRECLEDLTAAEFALSVEQQYEAAVAAAAISDTTNGISDDNNSAVESSSSSSVAPAAASPRKRKRAVDYEKLLSQLTKRIEDMTCQPYNEKAEMEKTDDADNKNVPATGTHTSIAAQPILPTHTSIAAQPTLPELNDNQGMGIYAYTAEERRLLLERVMKTRHHIQEVLQGHVLEDEALEEESSFLRLPEIPELRIMPEDTADGNSTSSSSSFGPKLYVREDGTVDWEGALQDRAALRKFGGAVWARINGQTPDDLEESEKNDDDALGKKVKATSVGNGQKEKGAVTAKIEETVAIQEARKKLNRLEAQLREMEKAHTALVASGIKAGQPVANVKLASLDPILRNKIRQSAEHLLVMEQQVSYQSLVYDLERIYTYLASELGNPSSKGYIPLQDRLNVAEYGLLESQVESCSKELESKGVLDADILAVVAEQMTDFKRRLGIDYYVTGLTYDREAIIRWLNDLLVKTKNGLMFYVKGTRLFWNDIVYCFSLIGRAAQGYTLKPREVRTIRRTFKDIITFIPVVIILIIPLSPVGHVLVFGAIQRFFPDFFPSCFTEQRQNLLQLYETTEFSEVTIKENLQERLTRFVEALVFFVASKTRSAYKVLFSPKDASSDVRDDETGS